MAAENCNISAGDRVAIWGCGPVGQFAIRSAYLLGAERVIGIDRIAERLRLALVGHTGGRGPDACMDAVGLEAHTHGPMYY